MPTRLIRLMAFLYLPFAMLVIAGAVITYGGEQYRELSRYKTQEETEVALGVASVVNNLDSLRDDVLLLAHLPDVLTALERPSENAGALLTATFLAVANTRREYQQLRWIDESGMERVRIDNTATQSIVIPRAKLQSKANRYYFTKTMALAAGQVYLSPLDLNVENGKVEIPHRPMVRIATPVFSKTGQHRGILILNFDAKKLITDLERQFSGTSLEHAALLNAKGYWLRSQRHEDQWGFMFGREDTYARRYPTEWAEIDAAEQGQFLNDRGLITFRKLSLPWFADSSGSNSKTQSATEDSAERMIVLSFVSDQELQNSMLNAKIKIWGSAVLLLLIGLVGSGFLAYTWHSRNRTRAELERSKDRNILLAELNEGVIGLDANDQCRVVNAMALQLLDAPEHDVIGTKVGALMEWSSTHINADDPAPRSKSNTFDDLLHEHSTFDHTGWARTSSGKTFAVRLARKPATENEIGIASVLVIQDITELRRAEAEAYNLAYFHPLTGLPNRAMLLDRLRTTVATLARNEECCAVLFIDLDQFKLINEVFGRSAGDAVLVATAGFLKSFIRIEDTVAHIGADHFIVVLSNLSQRHDAALSECGEMAAEIANRVAKELPSRLSHHKITVSIGISLMCGEELTPTTLLERAELAAHRVKESGRNAIQFFDPAMQTQIEARVRLEAEICDGLVRGEFVPYYQPKVNAAGSLVSVEALARWNHPQRGLVSPIEFIPVAEDSGLILILGAQMLEHVCHQLAAWVSDETYCYVSIAVNVSAKQFRNPSFVTEVETVLAATKAPADKLLIELTESMLADDLDQVIAKMNVLLSFGIRFSLDDFGTGYSSLSYLKRLPLSQVKIDRAFVSDMLVDKNSAALVRTIIAMAKSLGLSTVAEGIETPEQWKVLVEEGCEQGQGYLFGRPVPVQELTDKRTDI